jgi:2-keto-4-pentenoate hydratase/2-oxohepta-3-ene-1,7-dioic acid hydratase in catechol pathway
MRLCRFELDGEARYGDVLRGEREGLVQPLRGHPFGTLEADGKPTELASVRLLVPVLPSKLLCVGSNYRDHAKEMGKPVPESPLLFLKATSALLPDRFTICMPRESDRVDHEAELAVVIGRPTRNITPEQAREHIFGYTCFNDVTARDIQRREVQFTRAKSFDTFAPMGPFVDTTFDPKDARIRCRVNGALKQDGTTADMVFDVFTLIAFASQSMTLLPGDVLATGTPAGVGPLNPGDQVEVEITGLATLKNHVARDADPA